MNALVSSIRFEWLAPVLLVFAGCMAFAAPPLAAPKPTSKFQIKSTKLAFFSVHCSAILPDGKTLVLGGGVFCPGELAFWDLTQGKQIDIRADHRMAIRSVAVSKDGKLLATGGEAGEVKLWDAEARKVLAHLDAGSESTDSVVFSPDGKLMVSGSDATVRVWDMQTHKCVLDLPKAKERGCRGVAFSPDGKTLTVGESGPTVRFWDVGTWTEKGTVEGLYPRLKSGIWGDLGQPVFSPDGTLLAITGGYYKPVNHTVKLWSVAEGKVVREFKGRDAPLESILSMVFTLDGRHLITGGLDCSIRIWEVATGKELTSWRPDKEATVRHLTLSRDGKILVSCGGGDHFVQTWDFPAILKAIPGQTIAEKP